MFQNRQLLIATKHQKEHVIAPLLEEALGVTCIVNHGFDTDSLGTFTGEVERLLNPLEAAREKCRLALQQSNCTLAVASEGSFGPHPVYYFVPADEELLLFVDTLQNIEIVVREVNTETNFSSSNVYTKDELLAFAMQAGFPSHALVLRSPTTDAGVFHKGIQDEATLLQLFDELHEKYNTVVVQTDMRAMYNPTRMQVIKRAAEKLVQKIKSLCPQCNMPGFGITDATTGLVCSLCGTPTNSVRSYIYVCAHCAFTKEEMYPHGKEKEDPGYCNVCNP